MPAPILRRSSRHSTGRADDPASGSHSVPESPTTPDEDAVMESEDDGETPRKTKVAGKRRAAVESPTSSDPPVQKQRVDDPVHFHTPHQYSGTYNQTECLWSMQGEWPGVCAPGKGRWASLPLLLRPQAPVPAPARVVTEEDQGEAGQAKKENCYWCALSPTSPFSTLTTCRCCGRPPL